MVCRHTLPACLYTTGLRYQLPPRLWPAPHLHHIIVIVIFIIIVHTLFKQNFYFSLLCDWIFPISKNYFPFFLLSMQ
jgi:hypothetical protein